MKVRTSTGAVRLWKDSQVVVALPFTSAIYNFICKFDVHLYPHLIDLDRTIKESKEEL